MSREMEVELWKKGEAEQIMPEEKIQEAKGYQSELEYLIDELNELGRYDFNYGLMMIRLRLEQLIRNLFKKINKKEHAGIHWNLRMMSKKLLDEKIIDNVTYGLLKKVINACNQACHGFKIGTANKELSYATAIKLVIYFYNLDRVGKGNKKD